MEKVRFEKFTLLIDGIHKSMHKIKLDEAPRFGIQGVHVFWLFQLLMHPDGLTATELAAVSRIDRSLVSRKIEALKEGGYVTSPTPGGRKRYNERLVLTPEGKRIAESISARVFAVQDAVSKDINEEELKVFYSVLERIFNNFEKLSENVDIEE